MDMTVTAVADTVVAGPSWAKQRRLEPLPGMAQPGDDLWRSDLCSQQRDVAVLGTPTGHQGGAAEGNAGKPVTADPSSDLERQKRADRWKRAHPVFLKRLSHAARATPPLAHAAQRTSRPESYKVRTRMGPCCKRSRGCRTKWCHSCAALLSGGHQRVPHTPWCGHV